MWNPDEATLMHYTSVLKQQYEELERIVEAIQNESGVGIERIGEQMTEIKQTEQVLRPLREAYLQHHQRPSEPLRALTDETIELVQGLMPKLAELERASADSLRRLFPKIQGSVRGVQMRQAYQANRAV
jgi:hypothetical protein